MDDWSEAALRERIEMARSRMSTTIEQIGDRVGPETMTSRVQRRQTRRVHRPIAGASSGMWSAIRENPVPAGLVGAGLVWLLGHDRAREPFGARDDTGRTGPLIAGALALAVGAAAGMLFDSEDDDATLP